MKIAVINEVSAVEKNKDILSALTRFNHQVLNVGMKNAADSPALTYIETGLLGALLLNLGLVELVIGGCGTGQGFLNSVMQYPNVFAGLIEEPLDAWLFGQINGGNCVSLALNKGYGWAGDINLGFIFERLFSVEFGSGYPEHRKQSQKQSREKLRHLSRVCHPPIEKIVEAIDPEIVTNVLRFPGVIDCIEKEHSSNQELKNALRERSQRLGIQWK